MKIDLYTKAVLSVIAACLLVICTRDLALVGEAHAQMKPSQGPVYDAQGNLHVKVTNLPLQVKMD